MASLNRYSFITEYYDAQASLTRTYQFLYYLDDSTIEMYDMKTKRMFLKRCAYPSLTLKELFVGATISVFSRPLKVVDYGDEATRKHFAANTAELVLLITSKALLHSGQLIDELTQKELRITNIRLADIPSDVATRAQTDTRCLVVVVTGSDTEEKVKQLSSIHPGDIVVVDSPADRERLYGQALGPGKTTAVMRSCAVCVIKPHAITSGYHGPILQRLLDEGFKVTAIGLYTMTVADAEDFLEVYNGVVPEYKKLVEQMASGACWAIEVCAENAVAALRAVCGPHDPEVCHVLFPHTLRALYGVDRTRNAVHCTDLEEDGPLESEFFFSLMQNKR